jgi:hypothetical protein
LAPITICVMFVFAGNFLCDKLTEAVGLVF